MGGTVLCVSAREGVFRKISRQYLENHQEHPPPDGKSGFDRGLDDLIRCGRTTIQSQTCR